MFSRGSVSCSDRKINKIKNSFGILVSDFWKTILQCFPSLQASPLLWSRLVFCKRKLATFEWGDQDKHAKNNWNTLDKVVKPDLRPPSIAQKRKKITLYKWTQSQTCFIIEFLNNSKSLVPFIHNFSIGIDNILKYFTLEISLASLIIW